MLRQVRRVFVRANVRFIDVKNRSHSNMGRNKTAAAEGASAKNQKKGRIVSKLFVCPTHPATLLKRPKMIVICAIVALNTSLFQSLQVDHNQKA